MPTGPATCSLLAAEELDQLDELTAGIDDELDDLEELTAFVEDELVDDTLSGEIIVD